MDGRSTGEVKTASRPAAAPRAPAVPASTISPVRICLWLAAVALLLVMICTGFNLLAYVTGDRSFYDLRNLFALNAEQNIPTFFSGFLLLMNAMLLDAVRRGRRAVSRPYRMWGFLSALFVFLSFDELSRFHENISVPLPEAVNATGLFHFSWIVVYGAAVLVLALCFLPEWRRLAAPVRRWFMLAAAAYMTGAVGFEMLGGARFAATGGGDVLYALAYTAEEALEMAGLILLVYALLSLLRHEFGGLTLLLPAKPSARE